ncbi:MAG: isochorismatase family protein [Pyrinomonadaceae bacterium]
MIVHRHERILDPTRTALVVIDVQEAFRQVIPDSASFAARISTLVRGMQTQGVPVLVTEQYPRGLGHTVREILDVLEPESPIIEKTAFSSCGAPEFVDRLNASGRDQVVVAGIEAHICVNQTVHDLLAMGKQVHLAIDCISARAELNRTAALTKMQASGALSTTTEMSLFELMRDARQEHFKAIQALIK